MPKQKITIVGTGQVACLVVALLVKKNRELPEGEHVEISILGRDETSKSYKHLKENGILLNFKNLQNEGDFIKVDPNELKTITANAEDLKDQDHVFVTTKSYDYSVSFFQNLSGLKKSYSKKGEETTIVLAQNGIPCWFLQYTNLNKISLESVDPYNKLLQTIGIDNVIGCVLNLACNSEKDPITGAISYSVHTPIDKINIPIGKPNNDASENLRNLKLMFKKAHINVASRDAGISAEVWFKLQVNIAINALTTLLDCSIGHLLEDPALRKVVEKLSFEVNTVAQVFTGSGIELRKGERLINRLNTSKNHVTSTRDDFNSGKSLEMSIYDSVIELRSHLSLMTTSVETTVALVAILKIATKNRDDGMTPDQARESVKEKLDELIEYVDMSYRPPTPTGSQPTTSPSRSDGSGDEFNAKKRRLSLGSSQESTEKNLR